MTGYRICGELGVFTVATQAGPVKTTMYKGAVVPDSATDAEIRHHLSVGLIEPVAGQPADKPEPAVTVGAGQPAGGAPQDSVPADDPERVKAREKLPADGAAPDKRAAEATWVEYAVSKGYSYDEAKAAGKAELVTLFTG